MRGPAFASGIFLIFGLVAEACADTDAGAALYARYCATCHGEGGEGDGPSAALVTIPPANLTALARENDGVFPLARVIRRIDGRDLILAHGSPMPVYGAFFDATRGIPVETDEGPMQANRPVLEIVYWLASIQQ